MGFRWRGCKLEQGRWGFRPSQPAQEAPAVTLQLRRGLSLAQTPYSQLREAASQREWQNPAMKSLLTAGVVFLVGVALLGVIPGADIIPTGVRAVMDEMSGIW